MGLLSVHAVHDGDLERRAPHHTVQPRQMLLKGSSYGSLTLVIVRNEIHVPFQVRGVSSLEEFPRSAVEVLEALLSITSHFF